MTSAEHDLVPRPVSVERNAGGFVITPGTSVAAPAALDTVARRLADVIGSVTGSPSAVTEGSAPIRLALSQTAPYPEGGSPREAYLLTVDDTGVVVTARTAAGAFRAVETFRKLLPAGAEQGLLQHVPVVVPAVRIADVPRFAYRGVMLDVARSFLTVAEVKRVLDALVPFGISHLHLHLSDDQGWRIEILGTDRDPADPIDYSALTRISGATAVTDGEPGHPGFYTQRELADIVRYAADRFVTVVPEIDIPGHTHAVLAAIPELNTTRTLPPLPAGATTLPPNGSSEVGHSALDEELPLTYLFVRQVFRELAAVTGSPVVHLGGDESDDLGHERYAAFIRRALPEIAAVLPAGVGTMGWTEYAEAGQDQDDSYWQGSVLQYWNWDASWMRDFAAKGGRVVLSPGKHAYLDMKYGPSTPIGAIWVGEVNEVDSYYDWEPTAVVEGGLDEADVLGVEGCLWSETIRGADQALFLALPRAAAVLEAGWSDRTRDLADFLRRLGSLAPRFVLRDQVFFASELVPWQQALIGFDATITAAVTAETDVALLVGAGLSEVVTATLTTPSRSLPAQVRPVREATPLSSGTKHRIVAAGLTADDAGECSVRLSDGRTAVVTLRVPDRVD